MSKETTTQPKIEVKIPRKTKKASDTGFKTFRVKITTDDIGNEEKQIELHTEKLRSFLRENTNIEDIYDDLPVLDIFELVNQLDNIKNRARHYDRTGITNELITFLESENHLALSRSKNMLDRGVMSFGLVKSLFVPGTEIEIHDEELFGGRVLGTEYRNSMFTGPQLVITYEFISSNGRNFTQHRARISINAWKGTREIAKMPIRPLAPEVKQKLTERGKIYEQVAIGSHYMDYKGQMQVKKWWSWDPMRADGRIMIDSSTYSQFTDSEYNDNDGEDTDMQTIDNDVLWMTEPYIKGFSFATKHWGKFAVSHISPIDFRKDAFDQLVLDEDKKELVRALVTNGVTGFQDIISGKGGGCIFLLHGEPGVGKTLTAEAIAELLQRPLYSVSVGELGVSTDALEKNLRQILDVAQIWNAVILIDEADIFLEKRGHDVVRNALTGVFLRLTEYHQGVMFLTTNRVREFDPAFYSRISIALKYGDLTLSARQQIWQNLLQAADINGLDAADLATVEINGRQIKNTIRLAQGLARQEGVSVNRDHVMKVVEISSQFLKDVG